MQKGDAMSCRAFANIGLVFISLLIGFILTELCYRLFLLAKETEEPPADFAVYSSSIWEYDKDMGYVYKPNSVSDWAMVRGGQVRRCGTIKINSAGFAGLEPVSGTPSIAVFGDSFTTASHYDHTWLDFLNKKFTDLTGNPVNIRNYSRDGYGVLQMVDQAATLLDRGLSPDIIVFSIIGPDLVRRRSWRMEVVSDRGTELFHAIAPSLNLDPSTHSRAAMFQHNLTRTWCESMLIDRDISAPLLTKIIDEHRRLWRADKIYFGQSVDLTSILTCYVCNKITTGDPLMDLKGEGLKSGRGLKPYHDDPRFAKSLKRLQSYGSPIWLVYLPYEPEWRTGQLALNEGEKLLLEEIKQVADRFFNLIPKTPMGDNAIAMTMLPEDGHPSEAGLVYYADTFFPLIEEEIMKLRNSNHKTGEGKETEPQ